MNFKPTLWKSIVFILMIILADFFLASFRGGNCVENMTTGEIICHQIYFLPVVVLPSLIIGVLMYIVWSLFQKRKR
jgi:hypothetical protein